MRACRITAGWQASSASHNTVSVPSSCSTMMSALRWIDLLEARTLIGYVDFRVQPIPSPIVHSQRRMKRLWYRVLGHSSSLLVYKSLLKSSLCCSPVVCTDFRNEIHLIPRPGHWLQVMRDSSRPYPLQLSAMVYTSDTR